MQELTAELQKSRDTDHKYQQLKQQLATLQEDSQIKDKLLEDQSETVNDMRHQLTSLTKQHQQLPPQ